jgi:catechol 2,3-dioxygenase-like lactoylglutathione lyase family enzyme
MALYDLDHINIRTANLENMTKFYAEVLGLTLGDRPAFQFPGSWLYCGDKPVVHLVEDASSSKPDTIQLEHFAFKAEGLAETLETLNAADAPYVSRLVPGRPIRQVHAEDPDGNHIELQFAADEEADPALLNE